MAQALVAPEGRELTVIGVIKSELNEQFGLVLADSETPTQTLAIQLPAAFRNKFSPKLDQQAIGKRIRITGKRAKYMERAGLREVNEIVEENAPAAANDGKGQLGSSPEVAGGGRIGARAGGGN